MEMYIEIYTEIKMEYYTFICVILRERITIKEQGKP